MIYLRTGANGTGKTLLTLRDVREKSLKENRPVYHNGRFRMKADFGWKVIDIKEWQTVPDGAIFIVDECHNDFPVRNGKDPVPEHIKMLAEHRVRGFDFYMITQHPLNIDSFLRRLIGSPGWHQHLKRASGAPLVSVIEYNSVNDQCQKSGASASGNVNMVSFPKEVYEWYESTTLDTAKVKIPFQVKLLAASLLLIPLLGWYGWHSFQSNFDKKKPETTQAQTAQAATSNTTTKQAEPIKTTLTAMQLVDSYIPRIEGFPNTAPRYDEATKPVTAPYPAACIKMGEKCDCYSQQATRLQVKFDVCLQIVKNGYFVDWQNGPTEGAKPVSQSLADKQNGAT